MALLSRIVHRLRDARGISMIELLVAMTTGVVVTGALLAILDVTLRQQTRITDAAQANQVGRSAMSSIIDPLHSSCTGFGAYAIQGPSVKPTSPLAATGATNLWFLSAYGNSTAGAAAITAVTEHDINWTYTETSNTGQRLGTLTDYQFTGSGSAPNWKFAEPKVANASVHVLATNVIAPQVSSADTIFQYYRYEHTSGSTFGQLVGPLSSTELPSGQSTAEKAQTVANELAKVSISFTQAPSSSDTRADRTVAFSDSVVLRYDPSSTEAEAANLPCE